MTEINPTNVPDERFFNFYSRGLKHERMTRIACDVLKKLAMGLLYAASLSFALGIVIVLPVITFGILGGTLPVIAAVVLPILLGVFLVSTTLFGIKEHCKKRVNVATERLQQGPQRIVDIVERLNRMAEYPEASYLPGLTSSEIRFLKRTGVLSSEGYALVKRIHDLHSSKKPFKRVGLTQKRQRFAAEWGGIREKFKNDLPNIAIIREADIVN